MRRIQAFILLMMVLVPVVALSGCSSPKGISVNEQQSVVMNSPLLTAGILAGKPVISTQSGRSIATVNLSNGNTKPVKVSYRFYWYDAQGLDLLPFETPRTLTLAPGSDIDVVSVTPNLDARRVRLYLFL
ncbi:DUF1425 domain-containing protein [Yersinia ruckeri]|uniref:Putative lipoprotein n=1 Tax=Yersinia ruckeri TaxID=29486 RepID=A0A085UA44_YERRU|nr:DUF1425 domain-containing protein [Yersinia ruckeri]AKA36982.1 membrane protein [Yersinia ruckeri]ARZ01379.1 lipoprotein [Yersinia ruckeri]AUQ43366.1 DUF1425 domain-containing protein [Yersinia ruckeri]EEP99787.1 hypothetical protein yruck0001_17970 [Yersinia ruckeri ATCC 29473]EKN4181639.1 DUF1425 domain-containing protein [Yersinia ruckeri]